VSSSALLPVSRLHRLKTEEAHRIEHGKSNITYHLNITFIYGFRNRQIYISICPTIFSYLMKIKICTNGAH
jgi:adenosine deaminase